MVLRFSQSGASSYFPIMKSIHAIRGFMRLASLLCLPVMALPALRGEAHADSISPEVSLQRLLDGNQRFVAGKAQHPHQNDQRRQELAKGQSPFAVVLTCADSRVAPEIFFDQGLGDLFVLRNAGNVIDDHVLGSIEYAVEHLHASLVIVVGHEKCGAVGAALAGGHAPGHIGSLVESIEPAVEAAKAQPGDRADNTMRAHATRMAAAIAKDSPIMAEALKSGHVKVLAARYDLDTGLVELLP